MRVPSRYLPFDPEDRLMSACGGAPPALTRRAASTSCISRRRSSRIASELAIAARTGCRTVETYHTFFEQYFHHYLRWVPRRLLQRPRAVSPAASAMPSTASSRPRRMDDVLRGYGVATPIDVIPTGLDLGDFEAGDGARFRAAHGISPTGP